MYGGFIVPYLIAGALILVLVPIVGGLAGRRMSTEKGQRGTEKGCALGFLIAMAMVMVLGVFYFRVI